MLDNIENTEDKSENSFMHDALAPASLEFFTAYRYLEDVRDKLDIENLEGGELDRRVYERTGIKRKLSTRAMTTVIFTGEEGAIISKGDIVSSDDMEFESLEDVTVGGNGKIEVFVACLLAGSAGNVPAGSITKIPVSITGVYEVYNPDPVTNGYDEENDDELRKRYFDKLQRPGKAGNKYHYLEWAKEVAGVGDAEVEPRWNGPLTVKVVIIDSNKLPANQDLIDAVTGHIEGQQPFGANVTVVSAETKVINIKANIIKNSNYEDSEIEGDIEENLKKYLQDLAFKENYVSYAMIGKLIIDSKGVLDYFDLKVNNGTANIEVADNEVSVAGVIECIF